MSGHPRSAALARPAVHNFGEIENDYPHSNPQDFIRIDDFDQFEIMLYDSGAYGPRFSSGERMDSFTRLEQNSDNGYQPLKDDGKKTCAEVRRMLEQLQIWFDRAQQSFAQLAPANDAFGDAWGARQPYDRYKGKLSLDKIHRENERNHAVAVAAVRAHLAVSMHEACSKHLRAVRDEILKRITEISPHHNTLRFAEHNSLCAMSLLWDSWKYVDTVMRPKPYFPDPEQRQQPLNSYMAHIDLQCGRR